MTGMMMHHMSHKTSIAAGAVLVYDLDAANYSAVPTNGSTVAGTGNHTITVSNSGSRLSWNSANGGVFRFTGTGTSTTDTMYGGPNWVTGQSYSVFMAYKLSTSALGRLLNTQNEASKDWLMGSYSNGVTSWMNVFYPNNTVNLNSDTGDTNWHFIWGTYNSSTTVANLYIATNTQPAAVYKTATNGGQGGFNQLRLFSRAAGSEVQTGDVGFVKAYNGVLDLATIQSQHATYKARYYTYQMSMSGTNYFNINPSAVSSTATVEGWFYCNGSNFNSLGMWSWIGSATEWTVYFDASGALKIQNPSSGSIFTAATGAGYTPNINTWVHYAFTWNSTSSTSTTYIAYVNGYCVGSMTSTGANSGSGAPLNSVCRVGYSGSTSGQWNGFMRDFRISNTLRYTGSTTGTNYFTPPARGTLASDANTLALFIPTSSLVDSSSNNLSITNTGVTVTTVTNNF